MKQIKIRNTDTQENITVVIDETTGAAVSINFDEAKVHDGEAFHAFHSAVDPVINDKVNIAFKTPNTTTKIHLLPLPSSAGATKLQIIRGASITVDTGSALTVFNQNENSLNATTIIDVSVSPSVPGRAAKDVTHSGGTIIFEEYFGSDKDAGGQGRGTREMVLKTNTIYICELESLEAGLTYISLFLSWYRNINL